MSPSVDRRLCSPSPQQHLKSNWLTRICTLKLLQHIRNLYLKPVNRTDRFLPGKYVNMKCWGFLFFFFKKRRCSPLSRKHICPQRAALLLQRNKLLILTRSSYNCYYRGIAITHVLKHLLNIIKLDRDGPNKVLLEHRFICSSTYFLFICTLSDPVFNSS